MSKKIRLIIVDDNEDCCALIKERIALEDDMNVIGTAHDGIEGFDIICSERPDVVILDISLPKIDGIGVLNKIKQQNWAQRPIIIIVTSISNDSVAQNAMKLGANYYMVKPFSPEDLVNTIRLLSEEDNPPIADSGGLPQKPEEPPKFNYSSMIVEKTINDMGIAPQFKGYIFIKEAVQFCLDKGDQNWYITKDIYPYLAKKYDSNTGSIERSVRTVCERAWKVMPAELRQGIFGNIPRAKRPTNSEFIAQLARYIRYIERK